MTLSSRPNPLSRPDRGEPEPANPAGKRNTVAAICAFGLIAWCAMPAVTWLAQLGLSAATATDSRSPEPQRLPTCVVPDEGQLN